MHCLLILIGIVKFLNIYNVISFFCTGMTKIKMSNQPEASSSNGNDFIERRRAALERYLKRTAEHPVLVLDPDFREFLESGVNFLFFK